MLFRHSHTLLVLLFLLNTPCLGQQVEELRGAAGVAGEVQLAGPKFRLIRSVAGSKGSEQGGRYIIEDPRTVFRVPKDEKIVVYFEWEGPPGPHQFEGLWRDPEGKVRVISEFTIGADQRNFGAYWTLLLSEEMKPGLWALEARVDGERAGTHTFQIILDTSPESVTFERKLLSPAEIYQRAVAATVSIEKLTQSGERVFRGSGFFVSENLVVTTFQVIDGASSLRLLFSDGRKIETSKVIAWNRWQDWALIEAGSVRGAILNRAKPGSWAVGDRCYSLNVSTEDNRTIEYGDIIGMPKFPKPGELLNISFRLNDRALGSPLLDGYGDVIGVMGGGLIPGFWSILGRTSHSFSSSYRLGRVSRGQLAIPISQVNLRFADGHNKNLHELKLAGQFIEPLVEVRNITFGRLARDVIMRRSIPNLIDEKTEFAQKDGRVALALTWEPTEKRKVRVHLRLYDVENKLLFESRPSKVRLRPGRRFENAWKLSIENLPAGIYRIDVLLDQEPHWRTYFRMNE